VLKNCLGKVSLAEKAETGLRETGLLALILENQ
jgi:hypothetical protein